MNIHIIEVPEGEDREKRAANIFEDIIAGKLPQPGKGNSHPSPGSRESQTGLDQTGMHRETQCFKRQKLKEHEKSKQ